MGWDAFCLAQVLSEWLQGYDFLDFVIKRPNMHLVYASVTFKDADVAIRLSVNVARSHSFAHHPQNT